jgi:hypothetical protein
MVEQGGGILTGMKTARKITVETPAELLRRRNKPAARGSRKPYVQGYSCLRRREHTLA